MRSLSRDAAFLVDRRHPTGCVFNADCWFTAPQSVRFCKGEQMLTCDSRRPFPCYQGLAPDQIKFKALNQTEVTTAPQLMELYKVGFQLSLLCLNALTSSPSMLWVLQSRSTCSVTSALLRWQIQEVVVWGCGA